jgi:tRNA nucleotidyltransferase (CCA-adding enzyme)
MNEQATLKVSDLMSHGVVRALPAGTSVNDALDFTQRYGHEGYPVTGSSGDILGVLTQAVLGRAAHHRLGNMPVGDLILHPAVTIGPLADIAEARRLMLVHGLGQLPVVDPAGALLGIVTRTDLLRAWDREARPTRRNLAETLRLALPPELALILEAVAELARARGEGVYLVGGVPRDLCMLGASGEPPLISDLDIVVEGDAVGLARALGERCGGQVLDHARFGTATWSREDLAVDLVTARAEYYSQPAVLPTVEPGSLHSDLVRRDFTINTLAIDLSPEGFGRLIDRLGGLHDLEQGLIRVLHPLSFAEDPTRILRALRFEQRFGFTIEAGTAALIGRAAPWLARTTGARIQSELGKLLRGPDPGRVLDRLGELGVLEAVAPRLSATAAIGGQLLALPGALETWASGSKLDPLDAPKAEELDRWRLLVWLASQARAGREASRRLDLPGRDVSLLDATVGLLTDSSGIGNPNTKASDFAASLEHQRPEALFLVWLLTEDESLRERLWKYASDWSALDSGVDASDLTALGLGPGPAFGSLLRALRAARLDGEVQSRDEALALARRLVAELD